MGACFSQSTATCKHRYAVHLCCETGEEQASRATIQCFSWLVPEVPETPQSNPQNEDFPSSKATNRLGRTHHSIPSTSLPSRCSEDFDEELIGNMDETPPFFDVVPGCTIDKIGRKSVLIQTTGRDKRHLTVTLTVTASGKMLPSFIVFKGKRPLKLTHPSGVVVCVQEKGWMDETLMICYICEIRAPHTHKARSLLVLDSFKAYAVLSCEPCHHRKG